MKFVTLLSLLIFSSITFAQNNRLQLSVQALGGYSGEREVDEGSHTVRPPSINNHSYLIRTKRQPVVGLGAELLYPFGQHGAVTVGVDYLQARALHETRFSTTNPGGQVLWYESSTSTAQQALLRIPVSYQFTFGSTEDRIRPFLKAGVMGSYLMSLQLYQTKTRATLGQEAQENFIANEVQLGEDRLDFGRWQFPVYFAVGIQKDRVSLSVERNWFIGEQIVSRDDNSFDCGLGIFGCFPPAPHLFASTRQWQTTYLRFAYQLF